jgi:cyanophycinase
MKKTERTIIAVGGGESSEITEDSLKIIEKFVELSGGPEKARIIIMTVATDQPKDAVGRYEEFFERLKVKNFEAIDIITRSQSFDEEIIEKIGAATGLYFTGGDQLHVTTLMGGTPLSELIADKFEKGMVVGGTSAGAMMISSSMIVSGASDCVPRLGSIDVVPGMNFLKDAVIDTHFSQRGRHGRLLAAVARNPQVLGLGIDERTAMIVRDDIFEIIGEGAVTVVCAKDSYHTNLPYIGKDETLGIFDVGFHVLPEGYRYDLKKREPIPMPMKKIMGAANDE